jgi:hypothetical protein
MAATAMKTIRHSLADSSGDRVDVEVADGSFVRVRVYNAGRGRRQQSTESRWVCLSAVEFAAFALRVMHDLDPSNAPKKVST